MSATTSLKAGDASKMGAWEQREAEVLEELIVTWKAENPGIDGEIVFEAGQRPRVQAKDPVKAAFIEGFNDPDGHIAKAIPLRLQRAAQMKSNRAALPKPPWYALGETLRARQDRIFGGNPEHAFTCPKCHGHEFGTQCDTKDSSGWRVYCHHDICGWNGPYQEHVDNSVPAISPKALFAQLREMGVRCETCRFEGCEGNDDEFGFCDLWEPTSPPEE